MVPTSSTLLAVAASIPFAAAGWIDWWPASATPSGVASPTAYSDASPCVIHQPYPTSVPPSEGVPDDADQAKILRNLLELLIGAGPDWEGDLPAIYEAAATALDEYSASGQLTSETFDLPFTLTSADWETARSRCVDDPDCQLIFPEAAAGNVSRLTRKENVVCTTGKGIVVAGSLAGVASSLSLVGLAIGAVVAAGGAVVTIIAC